VIKTDKKCNLHEVLLYANSSDSDLPQRFKKTWRGGLERGRVSIGWEKINSCSYWRQLEMIFALRRK